MNSRHQQILQADEEGHKAILDSIHAEIAAEQNSLADKESEVKAAQDSFEEIATGLNAMLKSIEVDFEIGNMGDMLDSLGVIEDKINELIAAKAVLLAG